MCNTLRYVNGQSYQTHNILIRCCGTLCYDVVQPFYLFLQCLWTRLYVRDSLQSTISLNDHEAKQRLRDTNKELKMKLNELKTQLATLQATARHHLDRK